MPARIIDGKALAKELRGRLKEQVTRITDTLGRPPGLAVVLVGEDPASKVYVRNKEKGAKEIGVFSEVVRMPETSTQAEIIAEVDRLNASDVIDAFLVQLPLPKGIDEIAVVHRIAAEKDGDGLHPVNLGKLVAGIDAPRPCTPSGVMEMLDHAGVELKGKRAVVVGRSTIVGKPMALMLLERHATVTLCHSRTRDLADEVRRADVVVAAVGKAEMIRGDWIADGAAVVDVGINRVDDKLKGDVQYEPAAERASVITPVPGGVGPMTVALLLKNTVLAAARKVTSP